MYELRILEAEHSCHTEQVARLLRDYLLWLRRQFAHAPDFVDAAIDPGEWESELADLKGHFGAPHGAILLAKYAGTPAGCVTMRGIGESTCEMRSLFVRPAYQGHGIAKCLLVHLCALAVERGYKRILVPAGPKHRAPQCLYRELGFVPVGNCADSRFADDVLVFEAQTAAVAALDCMTKRVPVAA